MVQCYNLSPLLVIQQVLNKFGYPEFLVGSKQDSLTNTKAEKALSESFLGNTEAIKWADVSISSIKREVVDESLAPVEANL